MIKSEKFLDYSQPNFYHFSEDSIRLADYVVSKIEEKNLSENQRSLNCLDLCAGCGVIGLEVVLKGSFSGALNFCEINRDYSSFLIENQKNMKSFKDLPEIRFNNFFQSFEEHQLMFESYYDFIFCNPPYFSLEKNRTGDNKNRNMARFFSENKFKSMIKSCSQMIKVSGLALILIRRGEFSEKFIGDYSKDFFSFEITHDFCHGADLLAISKLDEEIN